MATTINRMRLAATGLYIILALPFSCDTTATISECADLSQPLPDIVPDGPGRVRSEPNDEAAFIYDQGQFRTFEIQLKPEYLHAINAHPAAEQYVPGLLFFEGRKYLVGIRYKGNIGAWIGCTANSSPKNPFNKGGAKTCPKLNMKISFNKYDPKGRFYGVKKLLFHAMNGDSSLMRERMGYWLYRQMGVPAPRAVHVRLIVNGRYEGVFINVEYIDDRFARSHFLDGEGNLYKETWPISTEDQATPISSSRLLEGLRTNENENPSVKKMVDFSNAVASKNGDARARAIQDWMSVDNTMRFIAADRTIAFDDGLFHFYCGEEGCINHNFYFYEEENANRVWLIPWDLDNAFVVEPKTGRSVDGFLKIVDEWNDHKALCERRPGAASGVPGQIPPSCDPLVNGFSCYFEDVYSNALAELINGPFSAKVLDKNMEDWRAQISEAVVEAHAKNPRQLSPQKWQRSLTRFSKRLDILRDQAVNSLNRPENP
jgi:CotH protein